MPKTTIQSDVVTNDHTQIWQILAALCIVANTVNYIICNKNEKDGILK